MSPEAGVGGAFTSGSAGCPRKNEFPDTMVLSNMSRLVSFSGKKWSGKSFAAKILEQHGFTRLSFASPLKSVCAKLASMSLERLDLVKDEQFVVPLKVSKVEASRELGIDVTGFNFPEFTSPRHMLQYIGTDVVRQFNPAWHIERFIEVYSQTCGNVVVDDVRFPNELECIRSLGGTSVYIESSRRESGVLHVSECSVSLTDFDNVIINDFTLAFVQNLKSLWSEN